mgnify:CR=1 FL=1
MNPAAGILPLRISSNCPPPCSPQRCVPQVEEGVWEACVTQQELTSGQGYGPSANRTTVDGEACVFPATFANQTLTDCASLQQDGPEMCRVGGAEGRVFGAGGVESFHRRCCWRGQVSAAVGLPFLAATRLLAALCAQQPSD